ncbi:hypothetical protein RHMOL_Rhmol10G0288100 [Rhododendron molle]|uniref:Uncharacterized protein n=1 Tax=Rhododendron molle TaxID=49168 RepID=A0ACC0M7I1_RHOML|nr:hypothetical protein RHMOL_Rhmol10G0288100 [Rhododendron molle]
MYCINKVKKPLYSATAMGKSYELMVVTGYKGTCGGVGCWPGVIKCEGFGCVSEIERAHLNCFPKVGEIRADGLMVKKKSFFYHLPDSLPIKHVFQGAKGTWFIHIEVCSRRVSDKSGVMMKYFSDYEEVTVCSNYTSRAYKSRHREQMKAATDGNCLEAKASAMPQFTPKTPPRSFPSMLPTDLSCKTSRNNIKRPDVGKRLVVASNKLGISASKRFSCWVGAEKIVTLSLEDFWTKSPVNISFRWRLETLLRLGFWSGYHSYAVHYASTEVYRKSHFGETNQLFGMMCWVVWDFNNPVSQVKQKSFFGHLPDSFVAHKACFPRRERNMVLFTWKCVLGGFLIIKLCLQECPAAQIKDQTSKILVSTLTTRR